MAEVSDARPPLAAYLYVLHLDGPGLAWEYVRRHPAYRRAWAQRRRQRRPPPAWGLASWEDPARDARDAHPAWAYEPAGIVQIHPDTQPPADARAFGLWDLRPGRKQLVHDGGQLILFVDGPGHGQPVALSLAMADGIAYLYAVRPGGTPAASLRALAAQLDGLAPAEGGAQGRPGAPALLELHTLQALDATLAGASLREVALGLVGDREVATEWHADGALRARVRRLVRRGAELMRGGYRRLAQLPPLAQGRRVLDASRP